MTNWRALPSERFELYSPVGLRLIDDFTGRPPFGRIRASLDIIDATAGWRSTVIEPITTPSGVLAYPGLERRSEVIGLPPRRYRVRLDAEFYRPLYRLNAEGIEFEAFPYNDSNPPTDYRVNPPQAVITRAQDVNLEPAANYPFPPHVRVLRGKVVDSSGRPVVDAEVKRGATERVLSGDNGEYALPLRWAVNGVSIPIDAIDQRTGRMGTINITLPQALGGGQTIIIS
jgi:hypothetical protein